jgi:tRNA 2-thiouridine synthesizing protein A
LPEAAEKEKIGMEIQNKNYYMRRNKMEIEGIKIDDTVDITDKVCPLTFVKAKVAIDELEDGEVIAIRMNDGEPVQNVPRSIKEEGHQILKLVNNEDGTYNLIVKKVED